MTRFQKVVMALVKKLQLNLEPEEFQFDLEMAEVIGDDCMLDFLENPERHQLICRKMQILADRAEDPNHSMHKQAHYTGNMGSSRTCRIG
jgi:hypothetical protein